MSTTTHTHPAGQAPRAQHLRAVSSPASRGGLGRYFDLNPAVFRLGFVVLTLLGGAGLLVYLAAVLVIPDEGKDASIAAEVLAERRDRPWPLVGLGLDRRRHRSSSSPAASSGRARAPAGSCSSSAGSSSSGRAAAAAAAGGSRSRRPSPSSRPRWPQRSPPPPSRSRGSTSASSDGVGDRVYAPATAAAIKPSYEVGIGSLRIDLSQHRPSRRRPTSRRHVGIGELR